MHDAKTGNIIGYAHRTKRGQDANWEGTSDGAEGNMLDEILAVLIENERMTIKKAIIDKDASCHEIILTRSPETEIVFCGIVMCSFSLGVIISFHTAEFFS